jgi:hypothetical protein
MADWVENETGIRFQSQGKLWVHWDYKIASPDRLSFTQVLDVITEVANFLGPLGGGLRDTWVDRMRQIFSEEHLAFEIDEQGEIHPAIDLEFQKNRQSTLQGLSVPRYANALLSYERISNELTTEPPNPKEAWRATFSTAECLFKLMFPNAPQLSAGLLRQYLDPVIQDRYTDNTTALRTASRLLQSMMDWVDASHNYRHEAGVEEPAQPPMELAILAISTGISFIRWVISIDQDETV